MGNVATVGPHMTANGLDYVYNGTIYSFIYLFILWTSEREKEREREREIIYLFLFFVWCVVTLAQAINAPTRWACCLVLLIILFPMASNIVYYISYLFPRPGSTSFPSHDCAFGFSSELFSFSTIS